jgi:hypothetical protein
MFKSVYVYVHECCGTWDASAGHFNAAKKKIKGKKEGGKERKNKKKRKERRKKRKRKKR